MSGPFHGVTLSASLSVNDIEKSLAWYRDLLGFTIHQKHERNGRVMAVSLRAGDDVRILITQDDGAKGSDRVKGEGFSLMITTDQSIDDLAASVVEGGGTLDLPPTDTPMGTRIFRVRDPDGFKFTISSGFPTTAR